MSNRRATGREEGFALIEVLFAIVILAVGLLGLAALMATLAGSTTQSRFLGTEVMLASEKLEDLNQLPNNDPRIQVGGGITPGTPVGSYSDTVVVSSDNGEVQDNPDGAALGAAVSDTTRMLTFQRQWIIETGVAGLGNARRITVLVVPLTGTALERAATFQTTTVRQ